MGYAKKAVFGSGFSMVAAALGSVIAYLIRIYLSKTLTLADFGLFFAVMNFVVFFLFFRDFGLPAALTKFIPELMVQNRKDKLKTVMAAVLFIQIFMSLILITILFLFSGLLAEYYFKAPGARSLLNILGVYVLVSVFFRYIKSGLIGFKRFVAGTFMEPMRAVLVLISLFIFIRFGVRSAALSYSIAPIVVSLFFFPVLLSQFNVFKYRIRDFNKTVRMVLAFGFPMILTGFSGMIIAYMDSLMLVFFTDLPTVGIYNVILPSALFILFFSNGLSTVIMPLTSELYSKNEISRIADGLRILYKYVLVAIIPLVLAVVAFPDFFLSLMFGQEFLAGSFAFQILLLGVLFLAISNLNQSVILGIGKPMAVTKIFIFAAGANFVLNVSLIPLFGIVGAAIATSFSYLLMFILTTRFVRLKIKISSPVRQWFIAFVFGFVYLAIIYFLKGNLPFSVWGNLVISVGVAGLVYICLCFFFRIIEFGEMKKYWAMLRRS